MENILQIENVTKRYKKFALENVSITLPKGCIMGFIGENGSGKSTTIKLVMDLIHKDSGSIMVMGCDHTRMDKNIREHIGVVLDECHFPDEMNIKNVSATMKLFYRTWDSDRFMSFAKKYAIPMDRKVKEMSRGMRMKLAIAVAMSHGTRLLILDEATSGLDPVVRDEILELLMDFIQDEEHSVFISSHILSDLEKICDYITFIHEGRVILSENKDKLLEQHGILKCGEEEFKNIRREAVIGVHRYAFGVEALVRMDKMPFGRDDASVGNVGCPGGGTGTNGGYGQKEKSFQLEPASLEQIMLYYTKNAVKA